MGLRIRKRINLKYIAITLLAILLVISTTLGVWGLMPRKALAYSVDSESEFYNIARDATVSVSDNMKDKVTNIGHLTDGYVDGDHAFMRNSDSEENQEIVYSDYIEFTWAKSISLDSVVLYNQHLGQAPTEWEILVTTNGTTWNSIATMTNPQWTTDEAEGKELKFDRQENVVGLQVKITKANNQWKHYTIYEICIYDSCRLKELEGLYNFAKDSTVSVSDAMATDGKVKNLHYLTDGRINGASSCLRETDSEENPVVYQDDYIDFVWNKGIANS